MFNNDYFVPLGCLSRSPVPLTSSIDIYDSIDATCHSACPSPTRRSITIRSMFSVFASRSLGAKGWGPDKKVGGNAMKNQWVRVDKGLKKEERTGGTVFSFFLKKWGTRSY